MRSGPPVPITRPDAEESITSTDQAHPPPHPARARLGHLREAASGCGALTQGSVQAQRVIELLQVTGGDVSRCHIQHPGCTVSYGGVVAGELQKLGESTEGSSYRGHVPVLYTLEVKVLIEG